MSLKIKPLAENSPKGWETSTISEQESRFNGMFNKRIGIIIQLIHNTVETKDGNRFEYDSPLFCERQGAISVPFFKDQNEKINIGFVHIDRPVLNVDIDTYHLLLEKALSENNPQILSQESIFGDNLIEVPRGMGDKIAGKIKSSESIAKLEAEEEMGITVIKKIQQIGNTYWNTTFSPTKVPIFALEISSDLQKLQPQELEAISGIEFIEINKVNEMILNGQILDSMSITAIKQLELYLASQEIQEQKPKKITSFMEFLFNLNPFS